jgi:hypothetical protein
MSTTIAKPSTKTIANWQSMWRQEFKVPMFILAIFLVLPGVAVEWQASVFVLGLIILLTGLTAVLVFVHRLLKTNGISVTPFPTDGNRVSSGALRLDETNLTWAPTAWSRAIGASSISIPRERIHHLEIGRPYSFALNRAYCDVVLTNGEHVTFAGSSLKAMQNYFSPKAQR